MNRFRPVALAMAVALALTALSIVVSAQAPPPPAAAAAGGPFDALHFRSIGPASMSGRISDLAVYEPNPSIYYVGTAHGGVWKTVNNGTTFEAQFQDQGLMSIGDVTVSQSNPDLVWVGTGESNNRQSTSWGDGVYKSTDGGRTWTHMGLRTSRHIHRLAIDPRDTNVVFVAATGSLWGAGGDRGVYKTVDGGKTWKHVLHVDDDTGACDIVMDPVNGDILYASTYQRRRSESSMNGGGPGSGLWKSTDAGETWTRLKGGLPDGPLGRIAVDVSRTRPNIVYALVEGPAPPPAASRTEGREAAGGAAPGAGAQGRAAAGGAAAGREAAAGAAPGGAAQGAPTQGGQPGGRAAQAGVSDAPTGLYRSDDAGATWRKVNNANPRPMYFSKLKVDPTDPEVVYYGGVGLHQSFDGGRTVATDVAASTHDDVHAIWVNPANPHHVLIGNDGGLGVSYDRAKKWIFLPNLPVGLFYHVSYDMSVPYNVCGGMQDNYSWCGPSAVRGSAGIANHHWATLQGGDGFVVLQDPTDLRVVYSESQDGNMTRVDRVTFETMSIRPQAGPGEPALRWNWDTPLVMSPHDPKVIYAAANRVFRSADRGLSWTAISPDLTHGADRNEIETMGVKGKDVSIARNDGIVAWPTIVSFAESPRRAGLLYAGTDDGNLSVSRDGGRTWTSVFDRIAGLPKGTYVSEVVPSRFDEAVVYATFDGHRRNDFETHVYASGDHGQTWRSLAANLKGEVVRTLVEDPRNQDVLYLGTETGLFVSIDRGAGWLRVKANLPTVRIDEMAIHTRDNALILATHGRSIWILDHLEPIQEFARAQAGPDQVLFTPPPAAMYRRPARDRNYEFWGDQTFFGENPPQAARISWAMKKDAGEVRLRIADQAGRQVREIAGDVLKNSARAGIQMACWDLRVEPLPAPAGPAAETGPGGAAAPGGGGARVEEASPFGAGCGSGGGGAFGRFGAVATAGPFVLPGTYQVSLVVDGKAVDTKPIRVAADPQVALDAVQRRKMFEMAMELHELQRRAGETANLLRPVSTQAASLVKEIGSRADLPADVRSSIEALNKDVSALLPQLAPQAGARGLGGGAAAAGAPPSPIARLTQAKSVVMGGMWPTQQALQAYEEARTGVPKAIDEARGLLSKATALSRTLAVHNLSLQVPAGLK